MSEPDVEEIWKDASVHLRRLARKAREEAARTHYWGESRAMRNMARELVYAAEAWDIVFT
jgi:hypothetical protein